MARTAWLWGLGQLNNLTCSHDKGDHRMKICDFGKDSEARLLFVAHARPVGDGEGDLEQDNFQLAADKDEDDKFDIPTFLRRQMD